MSFPAACRSLLSFTLKHHARKLAICQVRYCRKINFVEGSVLEKHRKSRITSTRMEEEKIFEEAPRDYLEVYPEFLPDPNAERRDRLFEAKLRQDMYRRRNVIEIPEFYVGSILCVTCADPHAPNKESKFLGICIARGGVMLKHWFILRNVVDGLGVEIRYYMYSPLIQNIRVMKLEKRLDDELTYLRDCPLEYSTFPFDMEATPMPKGMTVPVNPLKVKLNPPPWLERWERMDLKGVENNVRYLTKKQRLRAEKSKAPWKEFDLMLDYRQNVNDVEKEQIMKEIYQHNRRKERVKMEEERKKRLGN